MRIQSKRGVYVCVFEGALELRFSLSGVSGKRNIYNEFMTSDCFQQKAGKATVSF